MNDVNRVTALWWTLTAIAVALAFVVGHRLGLGLGRDLGARWAPLEMHCRWLEAERCPTCGQGMPTAAHTTGDDRSVGRE